MLRLSGFLALAACAAPLAVADEPFAFLMNDSIADIRPETIVPDGPMPERVVPADDAELADDGDMPEDEDLETMTYCCQPQWAFVASWLYLARGDVNNGAILLNDADDSTLLDAGNLDFNHQSGLDLTAVYSADACSGYELRYMWLDDWTSAARIANPGLVNIGTIPATGPLATTTFDTAYRSRFNTVEASARRALGESTLLIGFRYALLDEDLAIRGFNGGPETNTRFASQNDLFGVQLGIAHDWQSPCSCWGVGGFAKVGAYYNTADVDASLTLGGAPVGAASDNVDGLAFLGEAGIDATYCLRSNVTLRVGYRLLLVDGVAIAAEQIDRTGSLQIAPTPLDAHDSGTLFAHGFTAGVELTW